MPRNGSGTFTRTNGYNTGATVWATDRDGGVKIVASRQDVHDQDIANAITGSVAADGQTPISADLPMSGYRHNNVADGTARTHYASVKQVQDSSIFWAGLTTGGPIFYSCALAPNISSYVDGLTVAAKFHVASGLNATFSLNGLPAKNILVKSDGILPDEISTNEICRLVYDSSSGGHWQLLKDRVKGTSDQLTVTRDATGATLSFPAGGVVLPNTSASQMMVTNGSGKAASVDYLTYSSTHLDPKTDNSFILGSSSKLYQSVYTYGVIGGNATFKVLSPSGYGQYLMTNGDAVNPKVVVYPTGGVDINANASSTAVLTLGATGIIEFKGTMGDSTKAPQTVAPDDWVEIKIGATTRYLPAYAAS